jgi:hypothetical protein
VPATRSATCPIARSWPDRGSYGWNDQCLSIGSNGVTNHTWTAYYCTTVTPSDATGPGLYNLYVSY